MTDLDDLDAILGNLELGPRTRVGDLEPYVQRVVEAILGPTWAFVSDYSEIADFPVTDADLPALADRLGVEVRLEDLVVDVAGKLQALEATRTA